MAIQMRRGAYAQFDPSKMKAGEWAVSTDSDTKKQQIWMCFAPGIVKRMGTVEDFDVEIQRLIQDYLDGMAESVEKAQESAEATRLNKEAAARSEANAKASENQALSYKNSASASETNSAKSESEAQKYAEQAKEISESLSGALRPLGTINFANLPSTADASSGDMYNITDQFTTNDDFKEGAGNIIPAGSNVYLTIDRYWDVLAGTPVTGVKGNSESSYRRGNVNITPANIGALSTTGEASNTTVKFTESTSRTKPTTGEKISSIVGKIVKFLSDLKTVAFTGSYNDLSNKPLSLPANGGNASTVNGHTVNADVPSGAKFTDTHVTVADNLTSTSTTNALSANQGRILKNGLDEVNQSLAWIALPVNKNFIYNISEAYHEIWISFRIQYTLEAARPYIARDLYISTGERQGVVRIYTDSYYFDEGNRVTWGIQYDPINRKISVPENWINAYYNGVEFSPDKILHVRVR